MEYWDTDFPPFQLAPTSHLLKVDYKEFLWAKIICFDGITKKTGGRRECSLQAFHHPSEFLNCDPFCSSSYSLSLTLHYSVGQSSPWLPRHSKKHRLESKLSHASSWAMG